jgi:Pregnancy-associated plasma protein-A.
VGKDLKNISSALNIMKNIYAKNGINLDIKDTETLESKYSHVSYKFNNSLTAEMVSKGNKDEVNIYFITDYTEPSSTILGNSSGIPGSQGLKGSHNGVLINLSAHKNEGNLDNQLLGETAGHEMGHFLGLFHPTENSGNLFDPISDTPKCTSGQISTSDCENQGANNLMFWTIYSASDRSNGKKQDNLTEGQVYVLKRALIAK